jgi:hypothetical protein
MPRELLIKILSYTTRSTPQAFPNLVLISRGMQDAVLTECLRDLPVLIKCANDLVSFRRFVDNHPKAAQTIQHLWMVPDVGYMDEVSDCAEVVRACPSLVSFASRFHVLQAAMLDPLSFLHTRCTKLTVLDPMLPWSYLHNRRHGSLLMSQLTHLRVNGPSTRDENFPPLRFGDLTHISLSPSEGETLCFHGPHPAVAVPPAQFLGNILLDDNTFPVLQRIVLMVNTSFRDASANVQVRQQIEERDDRVSFLHRSNRWRESDDWMAAAMGGGGVWREDHL